MVAWFIFLQHKYYAFVAWKKGGQACFIGLGKAKQATFFSIFRKVIIVLPLTLLFPRLGGLGSMGVFLAEPVSNFIGGAACYGTMLRTVWPELNKKKESA